MKLHYETGLAFINVMLLILSITLLSWHLLLQSADLARLSHNLEAQLKDWQKKENLLSLQEKNIQKNGELESNHLETHHLEVKVSHLDFVSDQLYFGADTGVELFEVTHFPLQTIVAKRCR